MIMNIPKDKCAAELERVIDNVLKEVFTIEGDSLYVRSRVIGNYDTLYTKCQNLQNIKNAYAECEDSDQVIKQRCCCFCVSRQENAAEYY